MHALINWVLGINYQLAFMIIIIGNPKSVGITMVAMPQAPHSFLCDESSSKKWLLRFIVALCAKCIKKIITLYLGNYRVY